MFIIAKMEAGNSMIMVTNFLVHIEKKKFNNEFEFLGLA